MALQDRLDAIGVAFTDRATPDIILGRTRPGAPTLITLSAVDDRFGAAYQEYSAEAELIPRTSRDDCKRLHLAGS
jgi:hypothetical protein